MGTGGRKASRRKDSNGRGASGNGLNGDLPRVVRRIVRGYQHLLGLDGYRIRTRFASSRDDATLRHSYAWVYVHPAQRLISVTFHRHSLAKMGPTELRRLILHELLHCFYWELDDLFDQVLDASKFPSRRKRVLRKAFARIEHRRIKEAARGIAVLGAAHLR